MIIDEINSGGNQGNTIDIGDICAGPIYVPGRASQTRQDFQAGQDDAAWQGYPDPRPARWCKVARVARCG